MRLNAKLVRLPQRIIVATKNADTSRKAQSGRLEDVVLAFDKALGSVLKNVVEWALTAVPPTYKGGWVLFNRCATVSPVCCGWFATVNSLAGKSPFAAYISIQ